MVRPPIHCLRMSASAWIIRLDLSLVQSQRERPGFM